MSAGVPVTVVDCDAVSFDGNVSPPYTDVAVTTIVMTLLPPFPRPPIVHCRVDAVGDVQVAPVVDTIVPPPFNVMLTVDPGEVSGPLFVVVIVYVTFDPPITGSGESVTVTPRSEAGRTVMFALLLLFAVFGSDALASPTVALLVMVPIVFAFNTSATVADPPLAIVPSEHEIGPVPLHVPCDGVAETNAAPLNESVSVTLGELEPPVFVTVSVIVAFCP